MKIISVQSMAGGTGVTLTAAELALQAQADGLRVLAVDCCPSRHLRRDIEMAGFHYLDDVRQLFRPNKEARWKRDPMPHCGLLCYPDTGTQYLAANPDGRLQLNYTESPGEHPQAEYHLYGALAFLILHYDVMIVDVSGKDKKLMQLFHDVSDTVYLMLREDMPNSRTVDDWRRYIEKPKAGVVCPEIVALDDRKDVPYAKNQWGRSVAREPIMAAAQHRFGPLGISRVQSPPEGQGAPIRSSPDTRSFKTVFLTRAVRAEL
jgi:cellulose biosynthesis protein BcsQ